MTGLLHFGKLLLKQLHASPAKEKPHAYPPGNTRARLGSFFILAACWFFCASPVLAGNNAGQAFSLWPDTGQTTCYDAAGTLLNPCPAPGQPFYGQDAQYAGPARSYTKLDINGNDLPESAPSWAMVRDNVTGLIWEAKQNLDNVQNYANPHDADNHYSWCDTNPATNGGDPGTCSTTDTEEFLAALNGSGFGGHSDWRLPTIKELKTLLAPSWVNPAISPPFTQDTGASYMHWSSTTLAYDTSLAWRMFFANSGGESFYYKSSIYVVRAVRGGQVPSSNRYVVNGDTVTDTVTCLEWQRATTDTNSDGIADPMPWQDALAYAEGLSLGGHDDWRLPDLNELNSIVNHARYSPAIDITAFPDTVSSNYWSSTTKILRTTSAWAVDLYSGIGYSSNLKSNSLYVRAVRGGQCGLLGYSIISATAGVNGSLDESTPSPQTVGNGSAVQFIFNADTGYHVAEVSGCGVSYSNTSTAITSYTAGIVDISGDCTVSASFAVDNPITLSSSAFADLAEIPDKHTGNGDNVSPPLLWEYPPAGTQSFVVLMLDIDAMDPSGDYEWIHWVVYDIPANISELLENAGAQGGGNLPAGAKSGLTSWWQAGFAPGNFYQGPKPPPETGEHRYIFQVLAVDVADLNPVDDTGEGPSFSSVSQALNGHVLDYAVLRGTYATVIVNNKFPWNLFLPAIMPKKQQ
ncbi:MAG: YbhB/YbcL family Raf kinase inhibitor-like protein [Desulfobulbaceae bacterium]